MKKGFTLIEILLAVTVTAVIFPAVISLLSLSTFTTSQGETYTKAYTIAQAEMENVYQQKKDWDTFSDSSLCTSEGIYTKCTAISSKGDPDEKLVNVNISWQERGDTKNVSVESFVANIW